MPFEPFPFPAQRGRAGQGAARAAAATSFPRTLVEFRAGKLAQQGTTVTADPRKGMLKLTAQEDGFLTLTWGERTAPEPEDSLILFPEDAEVHRVPQCTTGRVLRVFMKSANHNVFFWLQEPKTDKDDELIKKMNDYCSGRENAHGSGAGDDAALEGSTARALFGGDDDGGELSNERLMALLAGMDSESGASDSHGDPASGSSNTDGDDSSSGAVTGSNGAADAEMADATSARASLHPVSNVGAATPVTPAVGSGGASTAPGAPARQGASGATSAGAVTPDIFGSALASVLGGANASHAAPATPSLNEVLNVDKLLPLLQDEDVARTLYPHVPESARSVQGLEELIRSPQFQQALRATSEAAYSGEALTLVQELGVSPALEGVDGMDCFLRALMKLRKDGDNEGSSGAK